METTTTSRFADMLAALGSEQRLEIIRLLIPAGEGGMTVGDIQTKLSIPNSTLSHHLEKLRLEGLVDVRRDRQWIWHSVNLEIMGQLISFLCARCYQPDLVKPLWTRIRSECSSSDKKGKSHEQGKHAEKANKE